MTATDAELDPKLIVPRSGESEGVPRPVPSSASCGAPEPPGDDASPDVDDGDPSRSLTDAWRSMIERLAVRVVPGLAQTGLVTFFPGEREADRSRSQRLPGHFLIRVPADDPGTPTVTPILSRSIDTYTPFDRVARGGGQLWRLDDSLVDLFAPGTRAIGVPLDAGETVLAALTLFRSPDEAAFGLDDLLTLDDLFANGTGPPTGTDPAPAVWQPAVLIRSRYVFALRTLLRELLTADSPYEVARRLARSARAFFDALSCVVYFVDPATSPRGTEPSGVGLRTHRRRLQLAASVGSGVLLTPPWLTPERTAGPESLFASSLDGPVLMATLDPDAVWTEPVRTGDDWLAAIPLRRDSELIAVLGLRCTDSLDTLSPVTIENFAFIAAIALDAARRRDAERSANLVLQSELARTRLAHEATVAMVDAADARAGLAAHAAALVPSVADGYLVYLDTTRLPVLNRSDSLERLRHRGSTFAVFSHWRTHQDLASIATFEQRIDDRVRPLLVSPDPDARPHWPAGGSDERLPLLLRDVSPAHSDRTPADAFGRDASIRSLAAVPLIRNDVTIGALILVTTDHGRWYGHRDFTFIASLAGPVTRVLTALLLSDTKPEQPMPDRSGPRIVETEDSTLQAEVAVRLIPAQDRAEVCATVAAALATFVTGWCGIELLGDDGEPLPATGASADPGNPWTERRWNHLAAVRRPTRGPSRVMRTGRSDLSPLTTWLDAGALRDDGDSGAVTSLNHQSSLSVAIRAGDDVVGVITCLRSGQADRFTLAELAMVEAVGAIAGTAIAAIDRLERARTDTVWLVAQAQQRTQLLDRIADAVIVADGTGSIVFANGMAVSLHGRADLGGSIEDYIRRYRPTTLDGLPFTAQTFPTGVRPSTGETIRRTWRFHPDDGSTRTVSGRAAPLRDDKGDVTGSVLTLHDVTDEQERYLRRQQSLTATAEELKASMTSLKGWGQYLAQRSLPASDPASAAHALEAMGQQIRSLQRLIDRLVSATGLDLDDPGPLQPSPVEIVGMLRRLGRACQDQSPAHRVTVHEPERSPVVGLWDPDALEHLLTSLFAAATSSRPTGGRIDVHIDQRPHDLVVSVTADGSGFPPDPNGITFGDDDGEDANRLDSEIAGFGFGFGLDLSRVRRQARRIAADIAAIHLVGSGITLSVCLPMAVPDRPPAPGDGKGDPLDRLSY